MSKRNKIILAVAGLFFLACCGLLTLGALFGDTDGDTATSEVGLVEEVSTTALPDPTSTPSASDTPTLTPAPTDTPTITPTAPPTGTPAPTATPTSTPTPTVTPTPIVIEGSGDAVVDVERPDDPSIIHITGNAASRHFAVTSYGSDGQRLDLLVNTTSPYDGKKPLDFLVGEHATRFEVSATGPWTISILPLTAAQVLRVPGSIEGRGDDVVFLTGNTPDLATIVGNDSSRHFAVREYGSGRPGLLVNTTDPYQGTVPLNTDTLILVISAVGDWAIDVTSRQ
jgi:hypothetical protein